MSKRPSHICAVSFVATMIGTAATSQIFTPDPEHWRPVHYYDLQLVSGEAEHYASIWADKLDQNNRAYVAKGDARFAVGNAPASEAHFSVNFTNKFAVLSVLNTATGCAKTKAFPAAHATVKFCPLRLAIWEGGKLSVSEATGCYLELTPANASPDPTASVSYVSYDVAAKSFRTGMIVAHKAVAECSLTIPLHPDS